MTGRSARLDLVMFSLHLAVALRATNIITQLLELPIKFTSEAKNNAVLKYSVLHYAIGMKSHARLCFATERGGVKT